MIKQADSVRFKLLEYLKTKSRLGDKCRDPENICTFEQ